MQNTTADIAKLDTLIKESSNILLICHTGADPDALSSLIALKSILKEHYAKEKVMAVGERIPAALSFIPGYKEVINGSISKLISEQGFDLIVCVDFSQIHMASKEMPEEIAQQIAKSGIPLVIIDHHPKEQMNISPDLYINLDPTSTATNLSIIFHDGLGFPITQTVADHLLIGILADTNRFKYRYGAPSQSIVVGVTAKLLEHSSLSIEEISTLMERVELKMLQVATVFLRNIKFLTPEIAYTTVSVDELDQNDFEQRKLGDAATYVTNNFISTVNAAKRGIVIYPHLLEENTYTVRFRSCDPEFPVNEWAKTLGGGGHPQSAAVRIKALSVQDALEKVLAVIK